MADTNKITGFVFYTQGDPFLGIPRNRLVLTLEVEQELDEELNYLKDCVSEAIEGWSSEKVTSMTIEQEIAENAAENAYFDRLDKEQEEFSKNLPADEFTNGLD